jgi:hypothetical protein|tara:strand:- start:1785 stop:2288 length:504 start_codon:yes stop_codon:yes gene_type:complete
MQKKVMTEQAIYFGDVEMPKDWEIDGNDLSHHILEADFTGTDFLFSNTFNKVSTYIKEYILLKHKFQLIDKKITGNIYKPLQVSPPLLNINPIDLKDSPDFTVLYGVKVEDCSVRIYYDDNRRKGRSWDMDLTTNKFIMFPSTNMYHINNNQKNSLNFIQTITYEYI